MSDGTRELRLVVTADDYEAALHFYRDGLGLRTEASFSDDNGGRATLMYAGRATLELGDEAHAEAIDALEVGRRVSPSVRLAFEVSDAGAAASGLARAGGQIIAQPMSTPWGSVNARLTAPDGQQLTVYATGGYRAQAPTNSQVLLVEPDPRWTETGAGLVAEIRETSLTALVVAHVGSTSIPGLRAKPFIDLVLGVRDPVDETAYLPALEKLGYRLQIREPEWHEHRLLKRSDPDVKLHVFTAGSPEIDRMLDFRDHLRRDRSDRNLYLETKLELASRTWARVQDYADAKSDVVEEILRRAQAVPPGAVRGCFVVVTGPAPRAPQTARQLAAGAGLPLLDTATVETALSGESGATGRDLTRVALEVVLALARESGGAVLTAGWPPNCSGTLEALPLPVIEVACGAKQLTRNRPVFAHTEQATIDDLLPAVRQGARTL